MKNILLPTDFSINSENAITYALEMFRGQTVNFHFLNVQKPSEFISDDLISSSPGDTVFEAVINDNKSRLKLFVSKFEEIFGKENYNLKSSVDFDVLTDAINQAVKGKDIDLIIMGTNGATGAREVLFGSNTLKVIRNVHCPVLAIPEDFKFSGINTLLFTAASCKDLESENAKIFKEFLEMFDPLTHILKIKSDVEKTHNCKTCIHDILKTDKFKSHAVAGVPVPMVVDTFVQLHEIDMQAMLAEKESFLDRFIFGSTTTAISYKTRVPLLIMHK